MPVTNSRDVTADAPLGVALLDTPIVLWRSPDGTLHAARDQCPHRGAALSLGQVRDDTLMCPYHGWVYDSGGQCIRQPASPGLTPPAERAARDVRRLRALRRRLRGPRRRSERTARVLPRMGRARRPPVPRRAGRGERVRPAHRRELPRHGPLPVRSRRRARRRVAHRGARLHGDRQGGRHRGHQLPVLATGGDSGVDVRGRRRVPLPGAPSVRGDAVQAPPRRRRRLLADDHGVTARRGALPDVDDRRLHRSRREHRRLPRRSTTGSSSRTCRSSNRNGHGVSPSTRPPSWRRRPIAPRTPTAAGSPTSACGTARVPRRRYS